MQIQWIAFCTEGGDRAASGYLSRSHGGEEDGGGDEAELFEGEGDGTFEEQK